MRNVVLVLKMLGKEVIFSNIRPMGGGVESLYHKNKKLDVALRLNELGYKTIIERFVTLNGVSYAIDVFAYNTKEKIVVEVGGCNKLKEIALQSYADRYFRVPYYDEVKNKFIV